MVKDRVESFIDECDEYVNFLTEEIAKLEDENDTLAADCEVYETEWHNAEFELECAKQEIKRLEESKCCCDCECDNTDEVIMDLLEENEEYYEKICMLEEKIRELENRKFDEEDC